MSEIKGTVRNIGPVQQITDKYSKRDLILDVTETWGGNNPGSKTFPVVITFGGNMLSKLDGVNRGEEAVVSYALRGRDYTDKNTGENKVFNSIEGYGVKVEGAAPSNAGSPTPQAQTTQVVSDDSQDLPF